eukprot:gene17856-29819_t
MAAPVAPWCLAIIAGRVDIKRAVPTSGGDAVLQRSVDPPTWPLPRDGGEERGNYKPEGGGSKLTEGRPFSEQLTSTGAEVDNKIAPAGYMMLLTGS